MRLAVCVVWCVHLCDWICVREVWWSVLCETCMCVIWFVWVWRLCDAMRACVWFDLCERGVAVCVVWYALRVVGSFKLQVSLAEYSLFYRTLLQKRPVIWRSLLIVAISYAHIIREQINSHFNRTIIISHMWCDTRVFVIWFVWVWRCVWCDVCMCMIYFVRAVCGGVSDVMRACVWDYTCMSLTWFVRTRFGECVMHAFVRRDSCNCVRLHVHMRDFICENETWRMRDAHVWWDWRTRERWRVHVCAVICVSEVCRCVWRDSCMWLRLRVHVCCLNVYAHDVAGTGCIHVCGVTHAGGWDCTCRCVTWWMWRMCDVHVMHMCGGTHTCVWDYTCKCVI